MILRAGDAGDIAKLLPRRPSPRVWKKLVLQAARSRCFAAEDAHGLFTIGGFYDCQFEHECLEAWMFIRKSPSPSTRNLLEAAHSSCEIVRAETSAAIFCRVNMYRPKHERYAQFLGFVACDDEPQGIYKTMIYDP